LKKIVFCFALTIISIISFTFVNYTPIKPNLDTSGLNLAFFSSEFEGIGIELRYYNYTTLYTESVILNRTIKLKTGESLFKAYIDLPVYNENFGVGYEYMLEKSYFGVLSLKNFQRLESKKLSHNFYNITLGKFNIPSYSIGNILFLKGNDFNFLKVDSLLYRPFKIPFSVGYSRGFYLSLPLIHFDSYYVDSVDMGFSIIKKNIYPQIAVSVPLNILKQNLHVGSRFAFGEEVFYEFYLFNENVRFPFFLLLNNEGGAIFLEL